MKEPVSSHSSETEISSPKASEREPTPRELAEAYLTMEKARVEKALKDTEWNLRWVESYEMQPPDLLPRGIEPGMLEYSEWQTALEEYRQWPEEQQAGIGSYEDKLDQLYGERSEVLGWEALVKRGDLETIERLAALERERRERLAYEKALESERKEGIELEGIAETVTLLNYIIERVLSDRIPRDQRGANGWILKLEGRSSQPYPSEQCEFEHTSTPEAPSHDIWLRVIKDDEGQTILVDDFRNTSRTTVEYWERQQNEADQGQHLYLTIRNGKVYNQVVEDTFRLLNVPHPPRYSKPREPEERFTQAHFDQVRELVGSLTEDVEGL